MEMANNPGKMEETRFEAEISNLNAMTAKIQAEMVKIMEETKKISTEPMKIQAEMVKIMEETMKISAERRWYPIASAGVGAIIAALIVAFSKFA
jgi:hypothetical protein